MDCKVPRDLFYMADEQPLRAHAGGCAECREWLAGEERLLALFAHLKAEAAERTSSLIVQPQLASRRSWRPYWYATGAIAAALLLAAVGIWRLRPMQAPPEIVVQRVYIIEGRVQDAAAPPAFVEVDGVRFPVQLVSAEQGVWSAELAVPADKREFVLCATDASGNRRAKLLRILE